MLYLAGQFAWFLLAGLGLGCVMGWVAQGSRKLRLWSPAWTCVAILWGIGGALAWFQLVNGRLATWIETALLFVAVYWLGCVAGALSGSLPRARPALPSTITAPPVHTAESEPVKGEIARQAHAEKQLQDISQTSPPPLDTEPAIKPAPRKRRKPKG
jgi:hypothetical protein